jgi:hypothetical protein
MNLYRFMIPAQDNNGRSYKFAIAEWETLAYSIAGGFTRLPECQGHWYDAATGKNFVDRMIPYDVMCSEASHIVLRHGAFKTFPDQTAFMIAKLGTAEVLYRDQPMKVRETVTA